MGCCTSTNRVKRPVRTRDMVLPAHHLASMPDVVEEDEKTDEKQTMNTNHRNYTEPDVAKPATKPDNGEVEMKMSQKKEEERSLILSRRMSIFNLYKDYGENILDRSIKPSRQASGIDLRRSRLQTEESVFKITEKQHEALLRFVDERVRSFHIETLRIYDNLCKNSVAEHEDLLLFLEDLRLNDKDIQNCVDDLLTYSFPNDTDYLAAINAKNLLVKKLILEYSNYQKSPSSYKEFRNRMLKTLLLYDPDLPNIKFSSLDLAVVKIHRSPSRGYKQEQVENSVVFVPREEKQWKINENNRDDLQDIDFNFALNQGDSGSRVFKYEVLKSIQDGDKQEEHEAMGKYYELVDEMEALNDKQKNLQESWNIVQAEVHEYKRRKNIEGDSESVGRSKELERLRLMEENMQKESEMLGRKYIELQGQLRKLETKLKENLKEQKEAMDFDYEGKLNEIGYQIDRKLKELIDLTLTMPMVFRDLEPQKHHVNPPALVKENSPVSLGNKANQEPLALSPLRVRSGNTASEEERNNDTGKLLHSLKGLSKEMRIGGPKTLTNESIKNLSSVLRGDVNDDVSVSDHEMNEISLPVSQKKQKYREYTSSSYGLSHSTSGNSREGQNTLSQIDNTVLNFLNGNRVY